MAGFGIGQPVRRIEDQRLLRGHGRYNDDINLSRQAYAAILRSPHAHAGILSIDADRARSLPGVLGIFTYEDLATDGLGPLPCPGADKLGGADAIVPARPALADGRVRYVGDYVALVVAETVDGARDAAEAIEVAYEPLRCVTDTASAVEAEALQIWPEAPANICVDWSKGDAAGVDSAFAQADHVVRLRVINNRVVVNSMEPRGAIGEFDPGSGRYTLHAVNQIPHRMRRYLCESVLHIPESDLRIITPDVGGGFGMKNMYPEHALVLWAAKTLGRPVKWSGDRSDAFVSDTHARDHVTDVELALNGEGRFLAIRASTIADMGAYLSTFGPMIPTVTGSNLLVGIYAIPAAHVRVRSVFTNTVPVDAYRGAGRPEVCYALERTVDAAARELGLSPAEIRRRNFVSTESMPYQTCMGEVYDSGDFPRNLADALVNADANGFAERRTEAKARGRLRGIGIATYIESCGGGSNEMAEIRVDADGRVALLIGSQNNGQGHPTAYAQIVSEHLGLPLDRIRLVQGDTDVVAYGTGTGFSRSVTVGGVPVDRAAAQVATRCCLIAAHMLETSAADIEMVDGICIVRGTDRSVTFEEIAARAYTQGGLPPELGFGISERNEYMPPGLTFPNGCHVCEVEVEPDTGVVEVLRYTVVDDLGKLINPMLVDGQVHGGIVQGIGQALLEHCAYDETSGQLLTGSFMDYTMPRADDVPSFDLAYNEIPCTTNPLGIKGAGEAGTIGSAPALINAIVDALSDLGATHVDMPATPQHLWRAIEAARSSQALAKGFSAA